MLGRHIGATWTPRHELVEQHAKGVDVRGRSVSDIAIFPLVRIRFGDPGEDFGGGERQRAEAGNGFFVQRVYRQAKVREANGAVGCDKDVFGLCVQEGGGGRRVREGKDGAGIVWVICYAWVCTLMSR